MLSIIEQIINNLRGIDLETADEIITALLLLPNVFLVNIYYKWNLISTDKDDNKFADCAVASNAHYLVSNDRHLRILKNIPIPKINVITLEEFKGLL